MTWTYRPFWEKEKKNNNRTRKTLSVVRTEEQGRFKED